MRLGRHTNGTSCEYQMQAKLREWLETHEDIKYISELHVSEVGRRADFTLIMDGKLINIEAKCNDFVCMINQLDDHATYCNYSFAYIPDYSITSKWFKKTLIERGYGLIIYNFEYKIVTEVLEAHHNKPKNKELRLKICQQIRFFKKHSEDNYTQQKLNL